MTARRRGSRRGLLLGGLALAGAYAGLRAGMPALGERLEPLTFEPIADPPGFRRMAGGATSGAAFDPLVGLDGGVDEAPPPAPPPGDLCTALFGEAGPGDVPIAYFSDHACTYCRVLGPRLAARARDAAVSVAWHELPLLGPGSVLAARATIAAGAQGGRDELRAALGAERGALAPARLDALARDLELDPARLRADMTAPATDRALGRSRALAELFGIRGTPALVVGRTLVVGALGEARLDRLIARERQDGPVAACA